MGYTCKIKDLQTTNQVSDLWWRSKKFSFTTLNTYPRLELHCRFSPELTSYLIIYFVSKYFLFLSINKYLYSTQYHALKHFLSRWFIFITFFTSLNLRRTAFLQDKLYIYLFIHEAFMYAQSISILWRTFIIFSFP